jgi:hypothetical protein
MQTLAQIMAALQAELSSALPQNLSLPGGIQMQPERLVVSLQFATREAPDGKVEFLWTPQQTNANGTPDQSMHSLSLEFRAVAGTDAAGMSWQQTQNPAATPLRRRNSTSEDQIKEALSLIFGPPGFDSSARATVFREAFDELSAEQSELVIESLSGAAPENDPAAKRARGLLLKLLKSAPLEDFEQVKVILTNVLVQNPLDSVLSLVKREWKSQEDWL